MKQRTTNKDSRKKLLLDSIAAFVTENGYSPTFRELCEITNIPSTSSVYGYLRELQDEGAISYKDGMSRTIRVLLNEIHN